MSQFNDERVMTGMKMPDAKTVKCRTCKSAEKEHICRAWCVKYPKGVYKPHDVCFENADCPEYERGEDLLPYEIEV
ncbi:hypothetical protein MCG98_16525 [Ruminococcus sp. OA3]|uniref:hypothetical protein n=1 Tax=Ruminococcus sp. OA3 TaxID=2914164 RepID=UPI001F063081|nr:hypothetical protein [Ruminococcus sp. OA3]MCH1984173.1 hypothetical protein [Ruminococcus sp. OA3]